MIRFAFPPPARPIWPLPAVALAKADTPGPDLQTIHALADSLEPALARTVIRAFTGLGDAFPLDALVLAIRSGRRSEAERLLADPALDRALGATAPAIRQALLAGAALESGRLGLRFDVVNPKAVAWAERHAAELVTRTADSVKTAIRSTIARSIRTGVSAPETARAIRPLIGLTERDATAVMNYRTGLIEDGDFSDARIDTMSARYADRLLRARADAIARTEIIDASSAGQQALWRDAVATGLLPGTMRQRWLTAPGACQQVCAPMSGQEQPLGAFFLTGDGRSVLRPPAHPRCRCGLTAVTEAA